MYAVNENIVARQIHDTFFLVDITTNYANDCCELYEINEIGYFIWNNINGISSVKEVTDLLIAAIDDEIDYDEVYGDVAQYVKILLLNKFLREE